MVLQVDYGASLFVSFLSVSSQNGVDLKKLKVNVQSINLGDGSLTEWLGRPSRSEGS
jgi:hypothetical protein